jgi:hypothetical protein
VLGVEQWAEIRRLHAVKKVPIKEIARRTECRHLQWPRRSTPELAPPHASCLVGLIVPDLP